ncbi:MAG: hypothetical protein AMXMBFR64_10700 [Myxococcales bacterium]
MRFMRAYALRVALLAVVATGVALPGPARAEGKYDLRLSRLGQATRAGTKVTVVKDQVAYDNVVRELGVAMAPKYFGPASTLGSLGFNIALETSFTNIKDDSGYWQAAVDDPGNTLNTMQLHFRKGLPFSLEVGGTVTHLFESQLWGVGLDLKFAALEGYRDLPDLSFRGNIHTVLGQKDLNLLTAGGDFIISKDFGIGGVVHLAPYAGYNLVYVYANSHPIAFFVDNCAAGDDRSLCSKVDIFEDVSEVVHRAVIGFQLIVTYVSVGTEIAITDGLQTYTLHIGADF